MEGLLRVLGAAALCAILPARAVYLDPEGVGQALIYPYYTAQSSNGNPFNTYITIANHTNFAKSLRVRFREGREGREVLGFNLRLSARQTWAAAVLPTPDGAEIVSRSTACASPEIAPSRNLALPPPVDDGFGLDVERLREGYAEVIEMATLAGAATCEDYRAERLTVAPPNGGLSGTLTLINVRNGMDFTVNAEALAELTTAAFHRPPDDPYPDFDAAEVEPHAAFISGDSLHRFDTPAGLQAVEAVLMRSVLENEIVLDSATRSETDWVVTLPTKRFHAAAAATEPFISTFYPASRDVLFDLSFRNRSGTGFELTHACGFLCPPQFHEMELRLPGASSVLSFVPQPQVGRAGAGTSAVLGSRNAWVLRLGGDPQNGQAILHFRNPRLTLPATSTRLSDGTVRSGSRTLEGLPALGFMVRSFRNGSLTCGGALCQGDFGGAFPHVHQQQMFRR